MYKRQVYGLYQGDELVASYTTDANGAFVSDYFICGDNWTLREISPSEGYLLDGTVYKIPAEPGNFTYELNPIPEDVFEEVIKGRIRIVKHIDAEQEVEESEPAPVPEATGEPIPVVSPEESQSVSGNEIVETEMPVETASGSDAKSESDETLSLIHI